jgi:hypothetical protein
MLGNWLSTVKEVSGGIANKYRRQLGDEDGNTFVKDVATEPGNYHFAIIPSDSTDLTVVPRCLFIGTAGDIALHDADGTAVIYKNWVGFMPIRARRVLVTGTTATDIVGVY